jgi:hypothetical protein
LRSSGARSSARRAVITLLDAGTDKEVACPPTERG